MAKARIKNPRTGNIDLIDLSDGWTREDIERMTRLDIIEEVIEEKPKKKKYKNVKQEKDEQAEDNTES